MPSSMRAIAAVVGNNMDEHRNNCEDPDCALSAAEDVVRVLERRQLTNEALASTLHIVGIEFMLRLAGPAQQQALASRIAELAGELVSMSQNADQAIKLLKR